MKEFSVPMAIVDYIPVLLFLLSAVIIAGDLKKKMSALSYWLFVAGAVLVTCAGFLKATYKLLYALGVGDFVWMSNQMFSNQSIGFLLAGIGIIMYAVKPDKNKNYAFLPTMALVGIMVVGLGAMDAGLCFIANKMKKRSALVCFIISFFMSLSMGYLSTKDFDQAYMNWVAQGVNIVGQGLLYLGCRTLHKAGLKNI
ncbi:MAG: hypothetical protein IKF68_06645 [Erysipelotrichaceae bacterium]|nr:hypothetical protein [Erysipelotrichaceae bacterium]